jgi:hypothetical protein
MPTFRAGTHINTDFARAAGRYKRIRISAGKHRGEYVDKLILEAKLGRPLAPGMTVEHQNGDTFDFGVCGSNLIEVTKPENSKRRAQRRRDPKTYYEQNPGAVPPASA